MSATLPPKDKLPAPVEHFKQRFGVGDDAVDELVSMQLNVKRSPTNPRSPSLTLTLTPTQPQP